MDSVMHYQINIYRSECGLDSPYIYIFHICTFVWKMQLFQPSRTHECLQCQYTSLLSEIHKHGSSYMYGYLCVICGTWVYLKICLPALRWEYRAWDFFFCRGRWHGSVVREYLSIYSSFIFLFLETIFVSSFFFFVTCVGALLLHVVCLAGCIVCEGSWARRKGELVVTIYGNMQNALGNALVWFQCLLVEARANGHSLCANKHTSVWRCCKFKWNFGKCVEEKRLKV